MIGEISCAINRVEEQIEQLFDEKEEFIMAYEDAHYPERINNARFEGLAALKKAGFTSVVEWHGGKWEDIPIG